MRILPTSFDLLLKGHVTYVIERVQMLLSVRMRSATGARVPEVWGGARRGAYYVSMSRDMADVRGPARVARSGARVP